MSDNTPGTPRPMEVGPEALRGLAHPLRGRLLDELTTNGPATATLLGRRLGESSGATSYHLRQLSRFGFVEDDPGHTGGRERWWRIRPGGWSMAGNDYLRDPATRTAAEIVLQRFYRERQERLTRWIERLRDADRDPDVRHWKSSAFETNVHLRLTPEETAEFSEALHSFLGEWAARFRDRSPESRPGTEAVEIQVNAFPLLPEKEG
ncbi:winged helix-turn-helix domain-containing protein [Nocardiopsis algeriensis]|uniref:DNA-binding MarR family transcriptional regulator n=1 Tax=Nocardiopsis algeriensis TaxID=1478215 RepID=A0A841ILK2_9ACTN|nr:helix-turn-helix domain-containing protein [Nocardiopsis algeriensis]MBB6119689.1 DNA-binding MarR family transcriptional regulator [Nocardiopsis algeriensis]